MSKQILVSETCFNLYYERKCFWQLDNITFQEDNLALAFGINITKG
jgi:hypothetical protein